MKMKAIMVCLAVAALGACTSASDQTLNALIIQNKTSVPVFDVSLRVPETHGIVSCSSILPGHDCSVGFPERKNENHAATLSWEQDGKSYTKPLVGRKETKSHPDYPYKAVVTILDRGQLDVYLD